MKSECFSPVHLHSLTSELKHHLWTLEKVTSRQNVQDLSDFICPNSGENHMLFHCCFIQRVEESEGSEANTWCGESALTCCSDEVLFFYSSVSGITHRHGEGWKKERKHVLLWSVRKMVWKVQFKGKLRALGLHRREALQGIFTSLV